MVRNIEFSAILQGIWIFDRTIMKNILHSIARTALCIAAVAMSFSCGQREAVSPDTEFSTWISAYTGGMLRTDASVRIVFCTPLSSLYDADGKAVTEMDRKSLDRLFSFSPALTGSVRIAGDDTVEFIPDEGEMKPGTVYRAGFRLGDVVDTGDSRLDIFRFSFSTAPREAQMEMEWILTDDRFPDKATVTGTIYFSETPTPDAEMRMLSCSYPDNSYRLRFKRSEDGLSSRFRISGLARGEEDRELVISLDGSSDGFMSDQKERVMIPSVSGFKVLGTRLVEKANPYIDITAPANSVVKAALDGTVIFAGWNDEAGYTIQLQHSNDIVTIYKHNQKLLKKTGDKVTAGSPIALVGSTGSLSTGDHLHFELWYKGEAADPTKYINF